MASNIVWWKVRHVFLTETFGTDVVLRISFIPGALQPVGNPAREASHAYDKRTNMVRSSPLRTLSQTFRLPPSHFQVPVSSSPHPSVTPPPPTDIFPMLSADVSALAGSGVTEDQIDALFRSLPPEIMSSDFTEFKPAQAPAAAPQPPRPLEQPLFCPSEDRSYVCNVCFKGFKRETNLMFHMATHRERTVDESGVVTDNKWDEPTVCPGCPRIFATKYQAKKHFLRRHFQGEKKYTCEVCNKKSFTVKEDYTMHIKSCGRIFSCTCGIQLRSQATLKRHCKLTGHEPASLDGSLAVADSDMAVLLGDDTETRGMDTSVSRGDSFLTVDVEPPALDLVDELEPSPKVRRKDTGPDVNEVTVQTLPPPSPAAPSVDEQKARDILAVLSCLL